MQKVITIIIPYANVGRHGVHQEEINHPQLNKLLTEGYSVKDVVCQTNNTGSDFGFGSLTFILEEITEKPKEHFLNGRSVKMNY